MNSAAHNSSYEDSEAITYQPIQQQQTSFGSRSAQVFNADTSKQTLKNYLLPQHFQTPNSMQPMIITPTSASAAPTHHRETQNVNSTSEISSFTNQEPFMNTIQLIKILIKTQADLNDPFRESILNLLSKCEKEIQGQQIPNFRDRYEAVKLQNQELQSDIRDALQLHLSHSSDLLYFKSQNQKLKKRIAEMEAQLLKQYVPQTEISQTLDILIRNKQQAYRDVYVSLSDFDAYDTKRILKLIQRLALKPDSHHDPKQCTFAKQKEGKGNGCSSCSIQNTLQFESLEKKTLENEQRNQQNVSRVSQRNMTQLKNGLMSGQSSTKGAAVSNSSGY